MSTGTAGGRSWLEVADRGPGLSDEDAGAIFERFVRLPYAREKNPDGSGLGLAIVDQVVRQHHGQIEIVPRDGGGSLFRVSFPLASTMAGAEAESFGRE